MNVQGGKYRVVHFILFLSNHGGKIPLVGLQFYLILQLFIPNVSNFSKVAFYLKMAWLV
jgi:hypothetical protein